MHGLHISVTCAALFVIVALVAYHLGGSKCREGFTTEGCDACLKRREGGSCETYSGVCHTAAELCQNIDKECPIPPEAAYVAKEDAKCYDSCIKDFRATLGITSAEHDDISHCKGQCASTYLEGKKKGIQ